MISVIVPVYNMKPYIEETLTSILRQSYSELEVILVDDGSTDGCGEICDRYSEIDKRVKVVHQENKGLSAARNSGLNICSGDKIAFLDSDDVFCVDALKKMSKVMDDTGADIVECNFVACCSERHLSEQLITKKPKFICNQIDRTGFYSRQEALLMQVTGKISCVSWNKLYRRKIWSDLRFCEGHNYEDTDIILPVISKAESIYVLDEKLIMYRKHKKSITATCSSKNLRDMEQAELHYLNHIDENIPQYFDKEIYYYRLNSSLNKFLYQYYLYAHSKIAERNECLEYIEGIINNLYIKIDKAKCKKQTRIAYVLYTKLPKSVYVIIFGIYQRISRPLK